MAWRRYNWMFFLCGKHWTYKSVCFLVIFLTVLLNEWLVYLVQSWRWPTLPISRRDSTQELVLLIVSDPQIVGVEDELPFPIGDFGRWDADRYLRKTFELAFDYNNPDVVIFLGDLMDEGSKATAEDYEVYMERFNSIFMQARNTKKIYLAGDNDIGGERRDRRTSTKIKRFEEHFENLVGLHKHEFVDFVKLDLRTYEGLSSPKILDAESLSEEARSPIKILLNHETVIPKQKIHIYPLINDLQPQLILSGHWHKSSIFECKDCLEPSNDLWDFTYRELLDVSGYMTLVLPSRSSLIEIMVPTCSYRMGVANIGYGLVIMHSNGSMQYSVLWLPRRYTLIYLYIIILGLLFSLKLFLLCVTKIIGTSHRKR